MGKTTKRLPDMTDWSDEAIAEFWATHDAADYADETEPADVTFERPGQRAVSVKMDEADIEALKRIAHEMGIGHTTLIRMWVKERLKQTTAA